MSDYPYDQIKLFSFMHGLVLIIYSVAVYYGAKTFFDENREWSDRGPFGLAFPRDRKIQVAALLATVICFWIQDRARHEFSHPAQAVQVFDEVLSAWSYGETRALAEERLDRLALEIDSLPWRYVDDDAYELDDGPF